MVGRCFNERDHKYYNKIANKWTVKNADKKYNDYYFNDGNIAEFNKEITEIRINCKNELDKIVKFYLQLEEVIKENKNIIKKERIKLKELNQKLIILNNENFYFNKCKLLDLRNDLEKKKRKYVN